MKNDKRQVFRIILIVAIICTLLFIFSQSLLPAEESTEVSNEFSGFLGILISPDTPFGSFIHTNIRKIAHFTEFFFLGMLVSVYVSAFVFTPDFTKKQTVFNTVNSLVFGMTVALLDETLQILSKRGPAIADVWLDTWGYVTAQLIVFAVFFIKNYVRKRTKN